MQRRLAHLAVALACALGAGGLASNGADGQIAYGHCGQSNDWACAKLTVPLDPSGATPGTVALSIRRHRAAIGEASSAIVALAGGPGQSAIPFAEDFAETLGPIAATRDLIVFDQRGVGSSDPLSCHAFERGAGPSPGRRITECAEQLGSSRAYYTTADTVADIEAIRQAGGYEKLVLYGTSYGTKVAEEYAQRYPQHVEALVLDSVVPPAGPNTLEQPTAAAVPRVLRQVCDGGACRTVTREPVADLARVLARMPRSPLRVRGTTPTGSSETVTVTPEDLLGILLSGDFSGPLRADFVTALAAQARGDGAPLARLEMTVEAGGGEEGEDFDVPLYYATTCEEQSFPWRRTSSQRARVREATAAARALPAGDFAPFTAAEALGVSDIPSCSYWPYAGEALQQAPSPLPAVPTLILSGADDLRTPTSGAREVQQQIPGSHLLVVPYVGHSVLGEDPTSCSSDALQALFASGVVKPCKARPEPVADRPETLPPRRLGAVPSARRYHGRAGRTVSALELTMGDLVRQLVLSIELGDFSPSGVRVGGLRSGWARLSSTGISFHDYSYVPGMTLSGFLRRETAALFIGGSEAVHGTLRLVGDRRLRGALGGTSVQLPATFGPAAAIVGADAAAGSALDLGHPADARRARLLAGQLSRLLQP
jgi:pimeloyl-ACP methyl ester carboxylesterase